MLTQSLTQSETVALARPPHQDHARTETHDLGWHLDGAPVKRLEAKEHVFTEGDLRSHIYRVESGAISLYRIMSDGRRQILGFAYPGDLIGLGGFAQHRFNAQATKPTQLRCMRWSTVQGIARHDPDLGLALYDALSVELAAAHDLLLSTGQRSAMERIATFLLTLSRRNERTGRSPLTIELPMTRADIGDFLGITIETVSRTFTKLRQLGIIDLAQSFRVRIVAMEDLELLAEGAG